jgi:hypothetical protein
MAHQIHMGVKIGNRAAGIKAEQAASPGFGSGIQRFGQIDDSQFPHLKNTHHSLSREQTSFMSLLENQVLSHSGFFIFHRMNKLNHELMQGCRNVISPACSRNRTADGIDFRFSSISNIGADGCDSILRVFKQAANILYDFILIKFKTVAVGNGDSLANQCFRQAPGRSALHKES